MKTFNVLWIAICFRLQEKKRSKRLTKTHNYLLSKAIEFVKNRFDKEILALEHTINGTEAARLLLTKDRKVITIILF